MFRYPSTSTAGASEPIVFPSIPMETSATPRWCAGVMHWPSEASTGRKSTVVEPNRHDSCPSPSRSVPVTVTVVPPPSPPFLGRIPVRLGRVGKTRTSRGGDLAASAHSALPATMASSCRTSCTIPVSWAPALSGGNSHLISEEEMKCAAATPVSRKSHRTRESPSLFGIPWPETWCTSPMSAWIRLLRKTSGGCTPSSSAGSMTITAPAPRNSTWFPDTCSSRKPAVGLGIAAHVTKPPRASETKESPESDAGPALLPIWQTGAGNAAGTTCVPKTPTCEATSPGRMKWGETTARASASTTRISGRRSCM